MKIKPDDLTGSEIQNLLRYHLSALSAVSPPCSMHALNLESLRKPNLTFWTLWSDPPAQLMGCGALMELDSEHAEIKSMRTAPAHLRKGVASRLMDHILTEARRRGYRRLSLETGTGTPFTPAHTLYKKFGFRTCGPFGSYTEDPNSVFMTITL